MKPAWRIAIRLALIAVFVAVAGPTLLRPPRVAAAGDMPDQWAQFRGQTYHVYRNGTEVYVDHATPNGGTVSKIDLHGVTNYGVGIATDRDDQQICVFATGADNAVYARCSWDGSTWDPWISFGGLTYRGVVGFNLVGAAAVAATGSDGNSVWMTYRQNNGTWVSWYQPNGMHLALGAHMDHFNNPSSSTYHNGVESAFNLGPATTSRVMMFNGVRNATPLVTCAELDQIRGNGAKTIVVRTSQGDDGPTLDAEMNAQLSGGCGSLHNYIVNQGASTNWIIEVGNEPDVAGFSVYDARYWAIDARNHWVSNWAGITYNARIAVSLPTERGNSSAPAGLDAGSYFDIFLNWNGDGRGAIHDLFDAYAVHTYTFDCLDRTSTALANSNYKALSIVDYTAAATNKPIYVTEMGVDLNQVIGNRSLETTQGNRYVTALSRLSGPGNQVRGAMAFLQDPANTQNSPYYGIDADVNSPGWFTDFPEAHAMGQRQTDAHCNGQQ